MSEGRDPNASTPQRSDESRRYVAWLHDRAMSGDACVSLARGFVERGYCW